MRTTPSPDEPRTDLGKTNALLTVLAVVAIGFLLVTLQGVLLPLFAALFLSYLGMPIMRFGRRCHVPVPISVVLVILVFAVGITTTGFVFYTSGAQFAERLPQYEDKLKGLRDEVLKLPQLKAYLTKVEAPEERPADEESAGSDQDPKDTASPAASLAKQPDPEIDWTKLLRSGGMEVAGSVLGGASSAILILFFLVFILLDRGREALDRRIVHAFSAPGTESARPVLEEIHREIELYIVTMTGISALTGALVAIALTILDLPFALLFGLIAFFMSYIPNVGSIVSSIPPLLVAAVHYDSPWGVVWVGICLLVIQGAIGFLAPMIMGKRLHLNPITVLIWLVIWGWLWGVWGMILSVPFAAVTRIILERTRALRAVGLLMSE